MHMVDVMYQNVLHLVNVSIPIQLMLRSVSGQCWRSL